VRRSRHASAAARVAGAGLLFGLAVPGASAQTTAWLDFDGAIPGEATDTRHRDWIEILGSGFGASREISAAGGARETSRVLLSELSLSKYVDRATPALFMAVVAGNEPYPKVTLDLDTGAKVPLARVELEQVLVSGLDFTAARDGAARPVEKLSLNFTKITFTYILRDGGSLATGYDLATRKATSSDSTGDLTDTDGDGMPDAWEELYGLDSGVDDSEGDLDGDGLSNGDEFELGTHPASGSSFFRSTLSPLAGAPESYQIDWDSVPGKVYIIEWTPDLGTPFSTVREVTAAGDRTTEAVPRNGELGFYRVRTP